VRRLHKYSPGSVRWPEPKQTMASIDAGRSLVLCLRLRPTSTQAIDIKIKVATLLRNTFDRQTAKLNTATKGENFHER
jgi:hypothetical protein